MPVLAAVIAAVVVIVPIVVGLTITSGDSSSKSASSTDANFKVVGGPAASGSAAQTGGSGASGQGAPSSGAGGSGAGSGSSGSSGSTGSTGSGGSGTSGSAAGGSSTAGASSGSAGSSGTSQSGGGAAAPVVTNSAKLGALVALLRHSTLMRRSPGGPELAKVDKRTDFGSPTTFLVVRDQGDWLGVVSSQAGNGRVGWVKSSSVTLGRVHWQLRVSLSKRQLTVMENGKKVRQYSVAVGRPDAPTPTGRFAVTDRLTTHDPSGPYGCCILALSAHSPHQIQGWSGGNRIAIHSTPDASSIGQAVSHGCVRVSLADGTWLLGHIPLGTPTFIHT
jgi:lipoprotein-anchoring transpeptidase ErfK/SrfK